MFKRLYSAAIVFGLAATAPPALAQQAYCDTRDTIVERLESRFGEALRSAGLQSASQLVEIWSSEHTGSWTILVTHPSGTTCVVASGNHWHNKQPVVMLPGELS